MAGQNKESFTMESPDAHINIPTRVPGASAEDVLPILHFEEANTTSEMPIMNMQVEDDDIVINSADTPRVDVDIGKLLEEINVLKVENEKLRKVNTDLKKSNFDIETILQSDELCRHYTGLSSKVVQLLCELRGKIWDCNKFNSVKILSGNNQILLTLIKLRRNLSYQDLAFRFGVSISTVQTVFTTNTKILHELLFVNFMKEIPSREKNQMFIPKCFEPYRNFGIVLDCTEIYSDAPGNMEKQRATFSQYYASNTVKFAIGCANNGSVTWCSSAYPGSTSDRGTIQESGILSELQPGDIVLANKGFLIADILPPGVSVNLPPFHNMPQFTDSQISQGRKTARGRIHIERINVRLKRFLILKHVSQKLFSSIELLVQLCCALINLQNPILAECNDFFSNLKR